MNQTPVELAIQSYFSWEVHWYAVQPQLNHHCTIFPNFIPSSQYSLSQRANVIKAGFSYLV